MSESKRIWQLAAIIAGVALTATATTHASTSVTVPNFSFENPNPANPTDTPQNSPVGVSFETANWTLTGTGTLVNFPPYGPIPAGAAVFANSPKPSSPAPADGSPYPPASPTDAGGYLENVDGNNLVYLFAHTGNSVSQALVDPGTNLPETFIAGQAYSLTVGIAAAEGAPPAANHIGIELYYVDPTTHSPVVVAERDVAGSELSQQRLLDFTATSALLSSAAAGQQINILITPTDSTALQDQFDLDNVRLSYAVPEPASLGLLALAGSALVMRRRRSSL